MPDHADGDDELVDDAAALRERGRFREAIEVYTRLLERHHVSELFNERGLTYAESGDHRNAVVDLTSAIALDRSDAECYVNRGNSYFVLGNLEAAADDYRHAIRLDGTLAQAFNGRGNVFARLGMPDQAIDDFRRAISLNDSYASPQFNLAAVLLKIREPGQALSHAIRASELLPADAATLCLLGDVYTAVSDMHAASNAYVGAMRADPEFVPAYLRMAWLLATCNEDSVRNGAQAVQYATQACEITRWNDYSCLEAAAVAHAECGNFAAATHCQTGAVALAPAPHLGRAKELLADLGEGRAIRCSMMDYYDPGLSDP